MARKGENVFKRCDGRYEARYIKGYVGKKAIYGYVYGKTYTEVKKKRNEILSSLNIIKSSNNSNNKILFKEAVQIWINKEKQFLKESSLSRYLFIIKKYLLPTLSDYFLEDIDKNVINLLIATLNNNKLSNNTIHDTLVLLNQILKVFNISLNYKIPKKEQGKINLFNSIEKTTIENEALTYSNVDAFGIILCLYTGLRIGEVCALKISDIDLENRIINIDKTLIRIKNLSKDKNKTKIIVSKPKSKKSIRQIPIPNKLISYLEIYIKDKNKNYFFLTGSSNFIEPRSYYNHYLNYLKKWNIEKHKFHDLRHTFATRCIETGFDPKILSELLGHATVAITLNLYVHPTLETKRKYLNKLCNNF